MMALLWSLALGAVVTILFEQLAMLAGGGNFLRWLFNTALLSVMRACLQLLFCAMAAYAFARLRFPGREFIFSFMLGTMMAQNLADHPERLAAFDALYGRIAIVAEDAQVELTMCFDHGRVTLHDGIVGIPDLTIRGGAEQIADLSRMESWGETDLPDPRGEVNRAMFQALREGRLRIHGLPMAFPLLARMGAVLAIE